MSRSLAQTLLRNGSVIEIESIDVQKQAKRSVNVKRVNENALIKAENFYWQGLISLDQQLYEEAHKAFSKAIELDPLHSDALFWRGTIASFRKDHRSAVADFCSCLCIEPVRAELYLKLADSQINIGQSENAYLNFSRYASVRLKQI